METLGNVAEYHSSLCQEAMQRREQAEKMVEELQLQHDQLVEEACTNILSPHQVLNHVLVRRAKSEPCSPRDRSLSIEALSPRRSDGDRFPNGISVLSRSTPSASPSASSRSRASEALKRRRAQSAQLSTDERLLMETCTFHPAILKLRQSNGPPVDSRPTKTSILREEAIWLRHSPSSMSMSMSMPLSSPGTPSSASIASRRPALEEMQNDEIAAARLAEQRRAEVLLSFTAGAEARSQLSFRKMISARGDKERRQEVMEQQRRQLDENLSTKQQIVKKVVDDRTLTAAARDAVHAERQASGKDSRDESRSRAQTFRQEEETLLVQRRELVKQMQEMEAERARLIKEHRKREIHMKRREIAKLRHEFTEQHQALNAECDQMIEQKRSINMREKGRKYEDLLWRAQQLEHLRMLDKQLAQQVQVENESIKMFKERRIQEAREQAYQQVQAEAQEKRQMLIEERNSLENLRQQSLQRKTLDCSLEDISSSSASPRARSPPHAVWSPSGYSQHSSPPSTPSRPSSAGGSKFSGKSPSEITERLTSSRTRLLKLAPATPRSRLSSSPSSSSSARLAQKVRAAGRPVAAAPTHPLLDGIGTTSPQASASGSPTKLVPAQDHLSFFPILERLPAQSTLGLATGVGERSDPQADILIGGSSATALSADDAYPVQSAPRV